MQNFIYTDASIKEIGKKQEQKNGIAIEINIDKRKEFYKFSNIKFIEGQNNINSLELLGGIFAIVLANSLSLKKCFIFNDNLNAIEKIQRLKNDKPTLFEDFSNIQFAWLQNDMEDMKMVDFLSREDFKREKKFDIKNISFRNFNLEEDIYFDINKIALYLENDFLLMKVLLGLKVEKKSLNKFLFNSLGTFKSDFEKNNKIENFNPKFEIKKLDLSKNPIPIKKTKCKSQTSIDSTIFKKNSIIKRENQENLYKVKGETKIMNFDNLIENNLFKRFVVKNQLKREKDLDIILDILTFNNKKIKSNINYIIKYIEESNNKLFILIVIKIFNINRFNFIFTKSNILKKKDYRRGIGSIINFFNENGYFILKN